MSKMLNLAGYDKAYLKIKNKGLTYFAKTCQRSKVSLLSPQGNWFAASVKHKRHSTNK